MPTSPLRNEVRVDPSDSNPTRITTVPIFYLDTPDWFSSPLPSLQLTTGPTIRKPLSTPQLPRSKYNSTPFIDHDDDDRMMTAQEFWSDPAPFLRNQSFSSQASDAPSMMPDFSSDFSSSDTERDEEDKYHERVAKEWDAYKPDSSNIHIACMTVPISSTPRSQVTTRKVSQENLFLAKLSAAPSFTNPRTTGLPKHRLHKSESSTQLRKQQPSRSRACTVTSSSISRHPEISNQGANICQPLPPTRPAPIPFQTQSHLPPMQPVPLYPPPAPPITSSQTSASSSKHHSPPRPPRPDLAPRHESDNIIDLNPTKPYHHTFPRRTQPAPLSLYPTISPNAPVSTFNSQPRHSKSTPHLRPSPCIASPFPPSHVANFIHPHYYTNLSHQPGPRGLHSAPLNLPSGWPQNSSHGHVLGGMAGLSLNEKSVWEEDDEDEEEMEIVPTTTSGGLLAEVAKKVMHVRSAHGGSGGSGTGSKASDGASSKEDEGEKRGRKRLRRSAGEMVKGLLGRK